ncbi:MAG TPA: GAF domain-containing sensor histidine kinase, partial [Gemmatimonadales bacterium]|nr:GAF domain-containing sensor histidine kinase [Gemmatimonadales bacterium]
PPWSRLYAPAPLIWLAVVAGWTALLLVYLRQDVALGFALAVLTTLLGLLAVQRGRVLNERQQQSLQAALEEARRAAVAAATRNRGLDRLRHLAATLLAARDLHQILQEIARAAAELLEADGGVIALLVEEGRFLKLAAVTGPLRELSEGALVPVDRSINGWVVTHDRSMITDAADADPRTYHFEGGARLRTVAIVPLRSAGVVIGSVMVYNCGDRGSFRDDDLRLLETLAEQAVVGVDRAHMLEEMRRNERALAEKNRELQRATQLKDEFLANMSHELRTPLNAIIGFSDLLLSGGAGPLDDTQREFLESVLRNGRHLLGLINSILDLSKIESGRMSLELADTDLREVITGVVADTASLRAAKSQRCRVELDPTPLVVLADGGRVRQILFNLLSNASKFTPEGGEIAVSAVCTRAPLPVPAERAGDTPQLAPREAVWVAVSDSGMGIKPEDMPKLFIEFSQVDASASRRQQGTGLGLALCKRFVEMHGGTIGVESIPDKGSTFWFILPREGPVRRR